MECLGIYIYTYIRMSSLQGHFPAHHTQFRCNQPIPRFSPASCPIPYCFHPKPPTSNLETSKPRARTPRIGVHRSDQDPATWKIVTERFGTLGLSWHTLPLSGSFTDDNRVRHTHDTGDVRHVGPRRIHRVEVEAYVIMAGAGAGVAERGPVIDSFRVSLSTYYQPEVGGSRQSWAS